MHLAVNQYPDLGHVVFDLNSTQPWMTDRRNRDRERDVAVGLRCPTRPQQTDPSAECCRHINNVDTSRGELLRQQQPDTVPGFDRPPTLTELTGETS